MQVAGGSLLLSAGGARDGCESWLLRRRGGQWLPGLLDLAPGGELDAHPRAHRKDGELDVAEALDTGADDCLTKPFSHVVLVARLRALIRRGVRGGSAGSFSTSGTTTSREIPASWRCTSAISATSSTVRSGGMPLRPCAGRATGWRTTVADRSVFLQRLRERTCSWSRESSRGRWCGGPWPLWRRSGPRSRRLLALSRYARVKQGPPRQQICRWA
jgi:hypothetical protein